MRNRHRMMCLLVAGAALAMPACADEDADPASPRGQEDPTLQEPETLDRGNDAPRDANGGTP